MTPEDRTVGRNLQGLRLDAGWSQGEFARICRTTQSTLCAVENGGRIAPAGLIVRACRALGCTPNDVFGWLP